MVELDRTDVSILRGGPPAPIVLSGTGEVLVLRDGIVDAEIEEHLRQGGFSVRVCGTDPEAFDRAVLLPPALVLADVDAGDERALQFGRRLRQALGPVAPPVVALVSGEKDEVFLRAYSFGVRDVLAKPASASLLRVKVARHLRSTEDGSRRRDGHPARDFGPWIAGYRVKKVLGRGGMGVVYLAEREGHDYAVKVLDLVNGDLEAEAIARFRREGEALRSLHGPGIPRFFEMGRCNDLFYLVMDYVAGDPLSSVAHQRPLEACAVGRLLLEVMSALEMIHAAGLLHRDVKPDNVIISGEGSAVLVDFGLAKLVDDRALTRADEVMGTLNYMAPELMRGEPATGRSDAYSLGMTALHAAAGRCPVEGSGLALAWKLAKGAIPRAAELIPQAPLALKQVIDGLLDTNPEARLGFDRAREFLRSMH